MKNQYFADDKDYRKYGLLRALQSCGDLKLLVAWMLTPDDGGPDGRHRSYLQHSSKWRHYDPALFDGLAGLVQSADRFEVSLIEKSGLLPGASYHRELVPDARNRRDGWRKGLVTAASGFDLVFFDPDNGLEVASKPVGRRGSSKYVTWREIEEVWAAGKSVLVYQHFQRQKRKDFIVQARSELRRRTGARLVEAYRTPHVLFLLAGQRQHEDQFREVSKLIGRNWRGQIEPVL